MNSSVLNATESFCAAASSPNADIVGIGVSSLQV